MESRKIIQQVQTALLLWARASPLQVFVIFTQYMSWYFGSLKVLLDDKQKHYVLYQGTGTRVLNENMTKKYLTSEKENIPLKRETEELILTKDSGKQFTSSTPNGKAGKRKTELWWCLNLLNKI